MRGEGSGGAADRGSRLQPLHRWPAKERAQVRFVFTDIDDTLSLDGRLPARAYAAMERLALAGVRVVPITGRPAGWCDHIARFWPVAGVVGENGAFWFRYDPEARRLLRRFHHDPETRRRHRQKLRALGEQVVRAVPGAALASDQLYRESDLAIDYCEDVPPLGKEQVRRIVALLERAGCRVKVSSIHVNAWFGDYDKLAMTRSFLQEVFGLELDRVQEQLCYIGDSPNDEPMFKAFRHSVGVRNVDRFLEDMQALPRWRTERPGGLGFAEFAEALLEVRN